jgi:micrococcal nuclease
MKYLGLGLLLVAGLLSTACEDTDEGGPTPVGTTVTVALTPISTDTPTTASHTSTATGSNPTLESSTPTPADAGPTPAPTSVPIEVRPGVQPAEVTRVVDGDTIEVQIAGATYRVRYIGIDTPETVDPRQPVQCYGREASERNRELVEGKTVGLEKDVSETDQYGRLLRYVWLDDEMVNAVLVREGYATAVSYPPDVKYQELFLSLQQEARDAGLGLWGPACIPTPVALGVCNYSGTNQPVIKGNISQTTGEKIYHVPGGEFYDKTVIDESAGERWFCTEQEAVAAGWRRSKR